MRAGLAWRLRAKSRRYHSPEGYWYARRVGVAAAREIKKIP
jgi:hypothetical protein